MFTGRGMSLPIVGLTKRIGKTKLRVPAWAEKRKAIRRWPFCLTPEDYKVDSISKPQACSKGSGMYLEFLLRRAHSRRRVERRYCSGSSLNSFTACSKEVTTGMIGPMGSGFPQFGFPRRFAINKFVLGSRN